MRSGALEETIRMQLRSPRKGRLSIVLILAAAAASLLSPGAALAASEADIVLPDLSSQSFFGINGHTLLTIGVGIWMLRGARFLVIWAYQGES